MTETSAGPPVSAAPPPPAPPPEPKSHHGWLAVLAIVGVLGLAAIAVAVISRGDDGKAQTSVPTGPTVQQKSTTINAAPTETVVKTVQAPPTTVQVQPQVTVQGAPSGETPTTPTSP